MSGFSARTIVFLRLSMQFCFKIQCFRQLFSYALNYLAIFTRNLIVYTTQQIE
nr:MAG TPA: hypothetical protein [Caudoviricetes sp.]